MTVLGQPQPSYPTTVYGSTTGMPPRPKPPADPWRSVAEIAALLQLSKMTVYRLIHSGELDAHRIGRSFRVRQSAFDAWLESTGTADRGQGA